MISQLVKKTQTSYRVPESCMSLLLPALFDCITSRFPSCSLTSQSSFCVVNIKLPAYGL